MRISAIPRTAHLAVALGVATLALVAVAWAAVWGLGLDGFLPGPAEPEAAPEPVGGRHNHSYTWTAEANRTGLVLKLRSAEEVEVETHWTNFARWNDTRLTLQKNINFYKATSRRVVRAGMHVVRTTSCHDGPTSHLAGEAGDTGDLQSCPKRDLVREANVTTSGTLGPGADWLYSAAYGAESADIQVTIHASGPIEARVVESVDTRLRTIREERTPTGHPQGGPTYLAEARWTNPTLAYAVFMLSGEVDGEPDYEAEGRGRRYCFRPDYPTYDNCRGEQTFVPGFPAPAGRYNLTISGGRRSLGDDDFVGFGLGQLVEPPFVGPDGWLVPVG